MTIEDLKETAALAHLNLSEEELAASFPAFEQMLGFFAAMQAADEDRESFPAGISGGADVPSVSSESSSHSRSVLSAHFRSDNLPNPGDAVEPEAMLDNAGERDGRFVVIPNVL
ncbi:MAG: aspartyl/glutamyl-tRNA amidotransferase subunit C [Treponema sp.]|jgi:aspartyl-tRNA(Asn)/glutamyl-tRNA(Gln) amidotransferase subunit C|nr:aspartyl/glutamyl-tRNA amidotransferase subunit C [Treponema sp.]